MSKFICAKAGKPINDSYRYFCPKCQCNYCWNCSKGYCPKDGYELQSFKIYSSGGGCFITTATLLATGKTYDCEELQVFRDYRDTWLLKQTDGFVQIDEYYDTAPLIVSKINNRTDSPQIYSDLWANELKPCYDLIIKGEFEEARKIYSCAVLKLKEQFLDKNPQLA